METRSSRKKTQGARLEGHLGDLREMLAHAPSVLEKIGAVLGESQNPPEHGGEADGTVGKCDWLRGQAVEASLTDLLQALGRR